MICFRLPLPRASGTTHKFPLAIHMFISLISIFAAFALRFIQYFSEDHICLKHHGNKLRSDSSHSVTGRCFRVQNQIVSLLVTEVVLAL